MKRTLTIENLKNEAKNFCERESKENHKELIGITDGKAVGTYVEHKFKDFLSSEYIVEIGNSASGIDLPDEHINTDIKVTSFNQPQSSCPFKNSEQKIFGLGYNLLVMVYKKEDTSESCSLKFSNCLFIDSDITGDYTTTKRIIEMVKDQANSEDIAGFLRDKGLPGDEISLEKLAEKILRTTPSQGYLTISNALQWRLQYGRAINTKDSIDGLTKYEWA